MGTARGWWRRVAYLFRRDRFAAELEEEMRLHIELRARQLRQQGVAEDLATSVARRQFGNRTALQDASSEIWGWTGWERLMQDLRQGARALRRAPGFAAVAIMTLAVGLGINIAVFSVVNAVMIRALPYPERDRLLSLWDGKSRPGRRRGISAARERRREAPEAPYARRSRSRTWWITASGLAPSRVLRPTISPPRT